jgi:hypothetical protein
MRFAQPEKCYTASKRPAQRVVPSLIGLSPDASSEQASSVSKNRTLGKLTGLGGA